MKAVGIAMVAAVLIGAIAGLYGCLAMDSSKGETNDATKVSEADSGPPARAADVRYGGHAGVDRHVGLGAEPNSYNQLKNADLHQLCMDIKSEDPAEGARAQLWNCTGVSEQQFIIRGASGPVTGLWTIRSKSGRVMCVGGAGRLH
jgi:hypothetical protein